MIIFGTEHIVSFQFSTMGKEGPPEVFFFATVCLWVGFAPSHNDSGSSKGWMFFLENIAIFDYSSSDGAIDRDTY